MKGIFDVFYCKLLCEILGKAQWGVVLYHSQLGLCPVWQLTSRAPKVRSKIPNYMVLMFLGNGNEKFVNRWIKIL